MIGSDTGEKHESSDKCDIPLAFRKVHGSYSSILPREVIQRQKGGRQLEAEKRRRGEVARVGRA